MNAVAQPVYQFRPEDRPLLPGGPFSPPHPPLRRLGYGAVGVLAGISATFGNALVSVDVANLAGALGLYVAQASLLPAIYVAMIATTNLVLIKARTQFGIPRTTQALLILYIAAGLAQFILPGFGSTVAVRAASGMAAAALIALSVFYLLQVFPPKARPASS